MVPRVRGAGGEGLTILYYLKHIFYKKKTNLLDSPSVWERNRLVACESVGAVSRAKDSGNTQQLRE